MNTEMQMQKSLEEQKTSQIVCLENKSQAC